LLCDASTHIALSFIKSEIRNRRSEIHTGSEAGAKPKKPRPAA
jgi:hypothetical protein